LWVVKVKERLTGAIILVALIVLLVPELLTGPIRSAPRATGMTTRAAGEPPLRSYTINLAEDAHAHGVTTPSGPEQPTPVAPAASPSTAQAGTLEGAPRSTPETATAAPAAPAAALPGAPTAAATRPSSSSTPPPAAAIAGAAVGTWMVQLGSFASRTNAEHLARQVRAQGFTVSVSQGGSGRRLYRVRVGPARDRAAASVLAQKLGASGHSGAIVPR
jgi:DedD protein